MSKDLLSNTSIVVCIPTYNNKDSIGETLDEISSQTILPDRIVICDKSNDGTKEVIRSISDEIKASIDLIHQRGDGVAAAYNQMIEYVKGEYDLFVTLQTNLQVTDEWLENHLRIHKENPEIDLVTGPHLEDGPNSKNSKEKPTEREVYADEPTFYLGRNFSAKSGVLERIDGWDSNFLRGEDWDMRIRLAGAGARVYSTHTAGWEWQPGVDDPKITFSKAKRRPTSLTFLDKYGIWYIWFHPSHVVGDTLSVLAVAFAALSLVSLPLSPLVSLLSMLAMVSCIVPYVGGLAVLRGGVDGSLLVRPVIKQFLVGIGVWYAAHRLLTEDHDWNRAGFDPDNVPRYPY